MGSFDVRFQSDGWHVSDGRIDFGPYASKETAEASATELNRQMAQRSDRNGRRAGASMT